MKPWEVDDEGSGTDHTASRFHEALRQRLIGAEATVFCIGTLLGLAAHPQFVSDALTDRVVAMLRLCADSVHPLGPRDELERLAYDLAEHFHREKEALSRSGEVDLQRAVREAFLAGAAPMLAYIGCSMDEQPFGPNLYSLIGSSVVNALIALGHTPNDAYRITWHSLQTGVLRAA